MSIVTFTGHRPQSMYGFDEDHAGNMKIKKWLFDKVLATVQKHKKVHFISGGALGVDTWAAEAVLEVREMFPGSVTLEIAVPCKNQDGRWSKPQRVRYRQLLDLADEVTMVSDKPYFNGCMNIRDKYMVDQAEAIISVWNGKRSSGTWLTLDHAQGKGLPMLLLHPMKFKVLKIKRGQRIFKVS